MRSSVPRRFVPLLLAACLSACSAGGTDGTSSATSTGSFSGSGGGGGGTGIGGGCAEIARDSEIYPVNLYLSLDRSSSMEGGNKWDAAVAGLSAFVQADESAGFRVAFRSFPEGAPACDQFAYKDPAVGWGELPGLAPELLAAIEALAPDGFSTPIYQALGGALLECIDVAQQRPDERAAVLLVTDGAPQGPSNTTCSGVDPEDPAAIADIASAAFEIYGVRTFVIGLPGVDQAFAHGLAEAGGSEQAILIGTTNVEAEFEAALALVRGTALPCEYPIPTEVFQGEITLGEVNVELSPTQGDPVLIPQNDACDGEGWRYDAPQDATSIVLCPASCAAVREDPGASIRVVLGCATVVL